MDLLVQAMAAHRGGRLAEAEKLYHQALAILPNHAPAHNAWGVLLMQTGRVAEAVAAWRRTMELDAGHSGACSNLGAALHGQGKLDEAAEAYGRAIALDPQRPEAHYNLGSALQEMRRLDEAVECYRRALACRSAYPEARNNLGIALRDLGRLGEAVEAYQDAIAQAPDHAEAHYNLGMALLEAGDLRHGFAEYEWRFGAGISQARYFERPRWQGEDLGGRTILVWAEQGFGDTLQFIRYVPLLAEQGARVVVEVQAPLVRLVQGMAGVAAVIAQGEPLPAFDVHAPLVSLAHLFRTTLETVPNAVPYVMPPHAAMSAWKERLSGNGLKIGLVWAGNPKQKNDFNRSMPGAFLPVLAACQGVDFYSLQVGQAKGALSGKIHDLSPLLIDFTETAAALLALDMCITVDTSVAHLAGALGVPVWVMLTLRPDWRYLRGRDDCPWYPSMRLFRQEKQGDWGDVVRRVAAALSIEI